jgi:hypothetical protein
MFYDITDALNWLYNTYNSPGRPGGMDCRHLLSWPSGKKSLPLFFPCCLLSKDQKFNSKICRMNSECAWTVPNPPRFVGVEPLTVTVPVGVWPVLLTLVTIQRKYNHSRWACCIIYSGGNHIVQRSLGAGCTLLNKTVPWWGWGKMVSWSGLYWSGAAQPQPGENKKLSENWIRNWRKVPEHSLNSEENYSSPQKEEI